jgi:hypothetical protein
VQIGAVQILLNHPVVIIGSTGYLDDFLKVPLNESAAGAAPYEHLAVPARAQVAPVKVTIWRGVRPAVGVVEFDGPLRLVDGTLAIFDVENTTRYTRAIGSVGVHRVTIAVDDPGRASRIDVVLGQGDGVVSLSRVSGYPLPEISGAVANDVSAATRLGLILDKHDLPLARLVNALELISRESLTDDVERAPVMRSYRVRLVVEWLRWLSPYLSIGRCRELGEVIETRLFAAGGAASERLAVDTAVEVWHLIEQGDQPS